MKRMTVGIKRAHSVELVDAEVRDGAIMTSSCPGSLGVSCTDCSHAWIAGAPPAAGTKKRPRPSSLILCHWHDAQHASKRRLAAPA